MSKESDYNINETNALDEITEPLSNYQSKNKQKIIIIVLSCIIGILVFGMVIYFCIAYKTKKSNDKDSNSNNNDNNNDEQKNTDKFKVRYNIPYFNETTNLIENTFKFGGKNYNNNYGDVNHGNDYNKSNLNYYSIVIPKSVYDNKDGYNKIFLWIHGGAWIGLNKDMMIPLCKWTAGIGYISATVGYTLLTNNSTDHKSMYRILDEITACLKNILQFLEKENIKINDIQMAIGGVSAGAHLSLLYSYFMNNPIIPIKYVLNIAGPVTINPDFYLENDSFNNTLENLEPTTIDKAREYRWFKPINRSMINPANLTKIMNYAIGYIYDQSIINEIIKSDGYNVDKNNQNYKDLLYKADSIISPLNFTTKDSPPTINYYGGNDDGVGVVQYSLLKKKYYEVGYSKDLMVYARNNTHADAIDLTTISGKKAFDELVAAIYLYETKYIAKKN